MKYNKDEIKNSLTIEQVLDLVAELGGEPRLDTSHNLFVARTICHGGNSHKLYYYGNTRLFRCWTDCDGTWDIFELVRKVKSQNDQEWSLPKAVAFVARYYGFSPQEENFENSQDKLQDWDILNNYAQISSHENKEKQRVEFKFYDDKILQYLPHPHILPWEQEGITREVMEARGICYNPANQSIIIPHYDINGEIVGIRERTLIAEEEQYGKYKPAVLNGQMYNHPLGFNLYNLNNSKDNIKTMQKAIVFEGEKATMLYASYFGLENDISVACCGSSLISHQVDLLLQCGAKEIIIAFDKQFQMIGDKEFVSWTKKLKDIHKKYSPLVSISFMFDKWDLLGYKDSPIDKGKETFLILFKERISL